MDSKMDSRWRKEVNVQEGEGRTNHKDLKKTIYQISGWRRAFYLKTKGMHQKSKYYKHS